MKYILLFTLTFLSFFLQAQTSFRADFRVTDNDDPPANGGDYVLLGIFYDSDALAFTDSDIKVDTTIFADNRGFRYRVVYKSGVVALTLEVDAIDTLTAPLLGYGQLYEPTPNYSFPLETGGLIVDKNRASATSKFREQLDSLLNAASTDSTRLIQDSILVYYQSSGEVGRDTISGIGVSSGSSTPSLYTVVDSNHVFSIGEMVAPSASGWFQSNAHSSGDSIPLAMVATTTTHTFDIYVDTLTLSAYSGVTVGDYLFLKENGTLSTTADSLNIPVARKLNSDNVFALIDWRAITGIGSGGGGSGASQLSELTDVNTSTPTNRNVLVADGVDWESRPLVEADISDLQTYLTSEVDASITNEGALDVAAGTSTTSVITSNTSGSPSIFLEVGAGLSISETADTITIVNTVTNTDAQDLGFTVGAGEITITGGNNTTIGGFGTANTNYGFVVGSNSVADAYLNSDGTWDDFDTDVSANTDVAANTAARHDAVTLSGTPDYITLSGQDIIRGQIDLTTDVTGVLPDANVADDITLTNITQITNRSVTDVTANNWRVFYSNGSGVITELALGSSGTFLGSNGVSSAPTWSIPAGSGDVSKVGTPVDN
jgi:molybdopterin-binding protein